MPRTENHNLNIKTVIDTHIEMNQMLELFDKDFKATTMKILQQSFTNSLKTNEKPKSQ